MNEKPEQTSEGDGGGKEPTVAELQAQIDAGNKERDQLKAQLGEARQNVEAARTYVQGVTAQLQAAAASKDSPVTEQDVEDFREQFENNPEAALDAALGKRMAPVINEYYENEAAKNRQSFLKGLSEKDRKNFGEEVDKIMANYPAAVRAKPDSYETAYNIVRGRNVDKIVQERAAETIEREKRAQTEGPTAPAARETKSDTLSPEEKMVAEKLGISEKDYLASKQEHEKAGGFWKPTRKAS